MRNLLIAMLIALSSSMASGQQLELFGLHIGDTKKQVIATLATQGIKVIGRVPGHNIADIVQGGPETRLDSRFLATGHFVRPMIIDGHAVKLIRMYYENKVLVKVEAEIDGLVSLDTINTLGLVVVKNTFRADYLDGKPVQIGWAEYASETSTDRLECTNSVTGYYDDVVRGYISENVITLQREVGRLKSISIRSVIVLNKIGFSEYNRK